MHVHKKKCLLGVLDNKSVNFGKIKGPFYAASSIIKRLFVAFFSLNIVEIVKNRFIFEIVSSWKLLK